MKLEVKFNSKENQSDYETVVLGNEGCIYLCTNDSILSDVRHIISKGNNIRFVTPIVPNKYICRLQTFIQEISNESIIKVTFNDFGLLYACRELIYKKRIIPVCGRVITRSMIDCYWIEKLIEGETEEIQRELKQYNFSNKMKAEFIKEFNIAELEINYHEPYFLELVNKCNMNITIYKCNNLLSIGRVCFQARYYGHSLHNCNIDCFCKNNLEFRLNSLWSKKESKFIDNINHFPTNVYLHGNVVYERCNIGISQYSNCKNLSIICEGGIK